MKNFVELHDGGRIPLEELRPRVPHISFMGPTHLDVCERWVGPADLPPDLRPVYLNCIYTKSERTKQVTALLELIGAGKLRVCAVESSFVGPEFADLLGKDVRIRLREPRDHNAIDRAQFFRFAMKVCAHRLFRVFRRRRLAAKRVIRAWVDTTDSLYPTEIRSALLLIYPFQGNLKRQLRYLRLCRRENRNYSMAGIPYRFTDVARIFLRPADREVALIRGEAHAYRKCAREYLSMGVERVFTTDEFEMAGIELYRALMVNSVHCMNSSHGVGVYGPHVKYSHFRFYCEQQREFYLRRSEVDSHDFRRVLPPDAEAPPDPGSRYAPLIVYIQGNWRQTGKVYEDRLEGEAIARAKQVCASLDMPLAIKVHPQVSAAGCARLQRQFGLQVVRELDELSGHHLTFVNLMSTAYYAFLLNGPTVFVKDELLRPNYLFGEGIPCAKLEDLESELARFRDGGHWIRRLRSQIDREERRVSAKQHDAPFTET
ncbi:MAG: hypothetical protein O7D32_00210 [bacterium]|nr:hypothetical protein [bacterium]